MSLALNKPKLDNLAGDICHTFEVVDRRRCRARIISSRRSTRKERVFYVR